MLRATWSSILPSSCSRCAAGWRRTCYARPGPLSYHPPALGVPPDGEGHVTRDLVLYLTILLLSVCRRMEKDMLRATWSSILPSSCSRCAGGWRRTCYARPGPLSYHPPALGVPADGEGHVTR